MKTAYLYVRVSTDEKKRILLTRTGGSVIKYCKYNNIEVKDIYREDYSAKDFNRPEWKKYLQAVDF